MASNVDLSFSGFGISNAFLDKNEIRSPEFRRDDICVLDEFRQLTIEVVLKSKNLLVLVKSGLGRPTIGRELNSDQACSISRAG